jgi:hypothetical protein
VLLKNSGRPIENLPISLYNNDTLIAKTSVALSDKAETTFSMPINQEINGKISIEDSYLQCDNSLYFNINKPKKINVLAVNAEDDSFLKRIFTDDEFNLSSSSLKLLDYNLLAQQQLIILNELELVPNALSVALKSFTDQGGSLLIVPSHKIDKASYNQLLANFGTTYDAFLETEKRITTINYAHPLYNSGVFEKKVTNFQYPTVNSFFTVSSANASPILQFEDGKPFLFQSQNVYVFTSALNNENSNFKNAPLIVPTLYNIGKFSFKNASLYYTIGNKNTFDVETQIQQDAVLTLEKDDIKTIPKQQYFNNKVIISTLETPSFAGTYTIKDKNEAIKRVSFNYDRAESNLVYKNLSESKNTMVAQSVSDSFDTIKSDAKVNALWKWFVIFALVLLVIEMGILKYFK